MKHTKRPSSWEEFVQLNAAGEINYHSCVECGDFFTKDNTHTEMGWRETQISGMCENCFDSLFDEEKNPK